MRDDRSRRTRPAAQGVPRLISYRPRMLRTSASSPELGRSRALVGAGAPPRDPACPASCGLSRRPGSPPEPPPAAAAWSPDTPGLGPAGDGHGYEDAETKALGLADGISWRCQTPPSGIRRPTGDERRSGGGRPGPPPLPRPFVPRGSVAALLPGGPAAGRKGLSRHILAPAGLRYSTDPLPPSSCRPALPGPCDRPTGDEQARRRGGLPGAPMRRPFGPRGLVADRGGDRRCAPSVGDRNKRG